MNTTLRDALAEQINEIGPVHLDVNELVGLGEQRLRRRRLIAVLGSAAAVVLAIALAISVPVLNRSANPVQPTNTHNHPASLHEQVRGLLYEDVQLVQSGNGLGSSTIHYDDHVIENDVGMVHLDVTDDGFVYTTEHGQVWFSDGGRPEQIGAHACGRGWYGGIGAYETNSVMTGNAGSLVAWFECPSGGARGTLAVFDTDSGREVVRERIAACVRRGGNSCSLTAVVGDHVYLTGPATGPLVRFDVTTGHERVVPVQTYADDLRSQPRGLVVGNSLQTGRPTNGIGQDFTVVGSRLVPRETIFDAATGHPVRLHLPKGYHTNADGFSLHEWLDDDTVALVGGLGWTSGDIIRCRLSDGRCTLAAIGHGDSWVRIVPQVVLPG